MDDWKGVLKAIFDLLALPFAVGQVTGVQTPSQLLIANRSLEMGRGMQAEREANCN